MATTIVASTGAAPLFTQGGVGLTPGYAAIDRRRMMSVGLQAGVIGATDFKVVQRAAGANLSVDITMTAGGSAMVGGTSITGQGLYYVPVHSTVINEAIATNAGGANPRLDSIYLQVFDTLHDASGFNRAQTIVTTGTVTAGATLDNRSGAAAAPANSILLADVLMAAGSTTATTANIRDRRRNATGAYTRIERLANAAAGNDYTTVSASSAIIDATNMQPRVECSGAPLSLTLFAKLTHSVAGSGTVFAPYMDGLIVPGMVDPRPHHISTAGGSAIIALTWELTPTAGSHTFSWGWLTSAATATLSARATAPLHMAVREDVRQNWNNT